MVGIFLRSTKENTYTNSVVACNYACVPRVVVYTRKNWQIIEASAYLYSIIQLYFENGYVYRHCQTSLFYACRSESLSRTQRKKQID